MCPDMTIIIIVDNNKLDIFIISSMYHILVMCIIGTDMQTQQKITAKLIHATTAFSERGKFLSSLIASERASTLQGGLGGCRGLGGRRETADPAPREFPKE